LLVNAVGLLIIITVLALMSDSFLTPQTGASVLRQVAVVVIVGRSSPC
jgi:ribose/xylose/arabinose/galactoside ABC-type transport system permease subunit